MIKINGVEAWKSGKVSIGKETVEFQGKPVYAPSKFDFPGVSPTLLPDPSVLGPGIATIGTIDYGETYPISLYTAEGAGQVLAVNLANKGIVLVMGCGHPGAERIVARAEAAFEQPVVGIVGGFHYERQSKGEIQRHIEFLQSLGLQLVAPSPHDSSQKALEMFRSAFSAINSEVQVGSLIMFPNQ